MSAPMTTELRAQIINSIKEGVTIAQAAETHGVKAKTISKWMRHGAQTHSSELQRAKKEIDFLRSVVLDLILEQKAANRKG
jgi:transposase-like protein